MISGIEADAGGSGWRRRSPDPAGPAPNPRPRPSAATAARLEETVTPPLLTAVAPAPVPAAATKPRPAPVPGKFTLPPLDLLDPPKPWNNQVQEEAMVEQARKLEVTLRHFGVEGRVTGITTGPVVSRFEYEPALGVKISKITGLADDLALALKALSIRIVAPVPGKGVLGIEIPNPKRQVVALREVLSDVSHQKSASRLTLALGKDIMGAPVVTDLARMPHLLIAGATGSGKSVGLNAMILSILFKATPDEVRFLLIDPKRIELSLYEGIPHLLHPVVFNPKEATIALHWAVGEMERRYALLSDLGARNIDGYNQKAGVKKADPRVEEGILPRSAALPGDRYRRVGRPDAGLLPGHGGVSDPPGPKGPGSGHPPHGGHPAALGGRDHRPHQGQLPHPGFLSGLGPGRLPGHPGLSRGRSACWAWGTCCSCRRGPPA